MNPSSTPEASRRWDRFALPVLVLVWAAFVVAPVWVRAARACFSNYDLGIYTQALARLSLHEPNPWLTSRQVYIFADHFDPVLWLARPLGEVLPAKWAGLVAEAGFVLLSVAPLVGLQRRGLLSPGSTALLGALLLFNTGTTTALSFPTHPTTWAVLPWVLLAVAYGARRTGWLLAALVLLFACKEEFPFAGLVLGAGLWLRGERRAGLAVFALSAAWLAFVLFGRSPWLGETVDYRGRLLPAPGQGWGAYLRERLAGRHLSRIGTLLVVFAPLSVWAWRRRWRPDPLWLALLVPLLGIRFAGMAWRFQYDAPVMAAGVMVFLPLLRQHRPPAWVWATTLVLLYTTNDNVFRSAVRTAFAPEGFPTWCPGTPERLASLQRARDLLLAANPRDLVLVGGNLVADLTAREELYAVGGPQADGVYVYDWVAVEKPPFGNMFQVAPERVGRLIGAWRAQPGTQVLIDDAHVFLARGHFTLMR